MTVDPSGRHDDYALEIVDESGTALPTDEGWNASVWPVDAAGNPIGCGG